jgi:hypothetical protein
MLYTDWLNKLFEQLANAGEDALASVRYMRERGTKVGFKQARPNVGAFWTIWGNIILNTHHYSYETSLTDPYFLSLIVHEVRHLQQGFIKALSVYGELDAWQVGFRTYRNVAGRYPQHPAALELVQLPWGWDRVVLQRGRQLMQDFSGKGYRIDLLPLYPLPAEVRYRLTGRQPEGQG